jgi:hypothetical protein
VTRHYVDDVPGDRSTGSEGVGRLPDFVVIGAMRSGTTSLHQWLRAHPDVYVPAVKELHYFSYNHDKGEPWYRSHFAPARDEQVVGESSQDYLYSVLALERMAARVPDARLVCVLRNPVDRAYSHYWHKRERGSEDLAFEDALVAEPERIGRSEPDSRAYSYAARGRYVEQLEHVATLFPRSALLVLLFDDLVTDPADTFRRVCEHLGVSASVPPNPDRRVNRYGGFRSLRLRNAARRLPKPLRDAVGRLNRRRDDYPPMSSATRALLVEQFRNDNTRLAAWLDRDVSSWNA